jgi:hypothetical protein
MPGTGSHDDETIAAELEAAPRSSPTTWSGSTSGTWLRAQVDELEAKAERHDLLLARLHELRLGLT